MDVLRGNKGERTQVYRIAFALLPFIGVAAFLLGRIYDSPVAIVLGSWSFALFGYVEYKRKVSLGSVSGELWRKYVLGALLLLLFVGPPMLFWVPAVPRMIGSYPGVARALLVLMNVVVLTIVLIQLGKSIKGQASYSRAYVASLYFAAIVLTVGLLFALAR